MMSKKTLMVLVFASIVLGCGKNSPDSVVVSKPDAELENAAYRAELNGQRQEREKAEGRILLLKKELASERKRDAKSERVKILEAELSQWEAEARQQRAEAYRIVRERKLKEQKKNVKDGGK